MDRVTRRCAAAGAGLTVGALIAAAATATPSLPDIQVREADLAAANVSDVADLQTNTLYEHVQQEFSGVDLDQAHSGLAELAPGYAGGLAGVTDPGVNFGELPLDQALQDGLLGVGFDPAVLHGTPVVDPNVPDAGGFDGGVPGGGMLGGDQTANAAGTVASSVALALQDLPAAYQAFTDGVVSTELALNQALVDFQVAAADKLFGADNIPNEFANWMFSVSNTTLAQAETALNNLLGANFDPDAIHSSLLSGLDLGNFAQDGWLALLGLDPAAIDAVIHAAEVGSWSVVLASFGVPDLFSSLF